MIPRIEILTEKKLIGKHITMSLAENKTADLWKSFMLKRKEIKNNLNNDLFSMRVYAANYFDKIDFNAPFEKWAVIEVSEFSAIPDDMETYRLPAGLYAVFIYKGSSLDASIYQYIYGSWIPNSDYAIDNRPHFEILGEKYKNADPDSEEEIWIPIKLKK